MLRYLQPEEERLNVFELLTETRPNPSHHREPDGLQITHTKSQKIDHIQQNGGSGENWCELELARDRERKKKSPASALWQLLGDCSYIEQFLLPEKSG